MRHKPKILPAARRAIIDVWHYTAATWSESQADAYVRGLHAAIEAAADDRTRWRPVRQPWASGVHFIRYEHHFIFFRQLSGGRLGVISVLHENMDIPLRLEQDMESESE